MRWRSRVIIMVLRSIHLLGNDDKNVHMVKVTSDETRQGKYISNSIITGTEENHKSDPSGTDSHLMHQAFLCARSD